MALDGDNTSQPPSASPGPLGDSRPRSASPRQHVTSPPSSPPLPASPPPPSPPRVKEEMILVDDESPRTPATEPQERLEAVNMPPPPVAVPEPEQVLRLTNFSIAEILKPSFGSVCKRRRIETEYPSMRHHHHVPYHSPSSSSCSSSSSSRGSPHSPRDSHGLGHGHGHYQGLVPSASHVMLGSPRALSPGVPSPGQRSTGDSDDNSSEGTEHSPDKPALMWPAWVYCTRYSDRPSSGPRSRKIKKREKKAEEKRPRTAFTNEQLSRLKAEFDDNRYLTEQRRQELARELQLNESQIKIWFQNKRAKMKKATGSRNSLALQLMAQGLYNHSTMGLGGEGEHPEMDMTRSMK